MDSFKSEIPPSNKTSIADSRHGSGNANVEIEILIEPSPAALAGPHIKREKF